MILVALAGLALLCLFIFWGLKILAWLLIVGWKVILPLTIIFVLIGAFLCI